MRSRGDFMLVARPLGPLITARGFGMTRTQRGIQNCMLLLLAHHRSHVEFRIPCRDLEQTGRLRAFLDVSQFEVTSAFIRLYDAAELRVYPDVAFLTLFGYTFILHGVSSVDGVAADLGATAPIFVAPRLFRGSLPFRAGVVGIVHSPKMSK